MYVELSNFSDFFSFLKVNFFISQGVDKSILGTSRDYDIFYIYRYMFSRLDHTILVGVSSFEPKEMDSKVLLMNQHVTRIQKTCRKLI